MRGIVIFATLLVVVLARPDVSHLAQHQTYGVPSPYSGNANGNGGAENINGGGSKNDLDDGIEESSIFKGFSSYDAPLVSGNGEYVATPDIDVRLSEDAAYASASTAQRGMDVNLIQGQSKTFDLTGGSGNKRVVYKPVIKQGEPIVTKNFYVHAAPEEEEDVHVEEKVHVVRPQKSYKIIFIKAPTTGSQFNAANYPIYPQNEEKTIVYVLSKKDDAISDFGEIPKAPAPVTHKPEVFFIKYKTKQEAAEAVANIQSKFQSESDVNSFNPQDYATDVGTNDAAPTDASFLPNADNGNYNDIGSTAATNYEGEQQPSNFGPSFIAQQQPQQTYNQDSNGGSSSFIPQILHRINDEDRKNYLPPNRRF